MDFDLDDDSLDDLLRDTSANKFTKPEPSTVLPDELLPSSNPQSSRKEKKSALLAELFGPSSSVTNLFDPVESSLDDQGRLTNQKSSLVFSGLPSDDKSQEEFKFGGYTPSVNKSPHVFDSKSDATPSRTNNLQKLGSPVYQPSSYSEPKSQLTASGFTSQQTPPASGVTFPSSIQQSFSKPQLEEVSSTSLTQKPFSTESYPKQFPSHKSELTTSSGIFAPQPSIQTSREQYPSIREPVETRKISNPEVYSTTESQKTSPTVLPTNLTVDSIPFTFQNVKNNPSREISDTNLNSIRELLESFSTQFCKSLGALVSQNEGLSGVTSCLNEIQKCLDRTSENWLASINSISSNRPDNSELEKKLLVLENKFELVSQENTSLRSRLEWVENQLRESRSDISKIKQDTDTVTSDHVKWTKEFVNSIDQKVSSQSSTITQSDEERNRLLRATNEKISDLENKLVKITSSQNDEMLLLLKREIKWLEQQKMKLNNDRKELQISHKQIKNKLKLFDALSMELSRTASELISQSTSIETKTRKMELLLTKFRDEGEGDGPKRHNTHNKESSHHPMEDLGLALWKLHTVGDEKKLMEQHNFLQTITKSFI